MSLANVSASVPPQLKKKMKEHEEENWSAVMRKAIEDRIRRLEALEVLEKFAENSTLTEEEAIELGRKVNEAMAKRLGLNERKNALLEKQGSS